MSMTYEPRPSKTGSNGKKESTLHSMIIERETADCYAKLRHQHDAGTLLQQLGNHADQIRQRELATLFASRTNLTEDDREAIAHMAARLQNQLLHHPRAAVRSAVTRASHHDHPHPGLDFVRHLFGLGDRAANSLKKSHRSKTTCQHRIRCSHFHHEPSQKLLPGSPP